MQFKVLAAVSLLSGLTAATMVEKVNAIPDCALRCYNNAAREEACGISDFSCICRSDNVVEMTAKTACGDCGNVVDGNRVNAGKAITELCVELTRNPSDNDTTTAASTLSDRVNRAVERGAGSLLNPPTMVKGLMGAAAVGVAAFML